MAKNKNAKPKTTEAQKLRELELNELQLRAAELQKEMFDLRQKLVTKEEARNTRLRETRRGYARVLTVLRQKLAAKA